MRINNKTYVYVLFYKDDNNIDKQFNTLCKGLIILNMPMWWSYYANVSTMSQQSTIILLQLIAFFSFERLLQNALKQVFVKLTVRPSDRLVYAFRWHQIRSNWMPPLTLWGRFLISKLMHRSNRDPKVCGWLMTVMMLNYYVHNTLPIKWVSVDVYTRFLAWYIFPIN